MKIEEKKMMSWCEGEVHFLPCSSSHLDHLEIPFHVLDNERLIQFFKSDDGKMCSSSRLDYVQISTNGK